MQGVQRQQDFNAWRTSGQSAHDFGNRSFGQGFGGRDSKEAGLVVAALAVAGLAAAGSTVASVARAPLATP